MKMPKQIIVGVCGLLIMAALAGTFVLYSRPDFLLQMANQIWACF
jgi:hypothetical protein